MIELSELIRSLRRELNTAIDEGRSEQVRFELGPVELELTVVVDKEASGGAKVRFWVAELGADGRLARSDTQRITVTLQPRLTNSGAPPWIGGSAIEGEK
ncbi:trypco2 family protein [Streptomyces bobili]|uniref:trypco2 family protein n=1 Tax=Streptomyces bobili TaxID=67280 RepID=UPI0036E942BD